MKYSKTKHTWHAKHGAVRVLWTTCPWSWRQYNPSKHKKPLTQWHSITSQKPWILKVQYSQSLKKTSP